MLFSTLVTSTLALVASVTALPASSESLKRNGYTPATDLTELSNRMPLTTLPRPDGLKLKYVVLGIGTQNYTCLGDPSAAPATTGAVAKLYDIGTALNKDPVAAAWKISTLSGLALNMHAYPKLFEPFLRSQGFQQVVGDHFFTQSTPTFYLNKIQAKPFPLAFVGKKAEIDAPPNSCPGTKNEGAIKWLLLADDQGLSKGGINTVYRLETAGGNKPQTCSGQPKTFQVPYAAQYWVFGK